MNKFWVIFSHTFMTRVKAKSFMISTVIALLFIVGAVNIQSIIDVFSDGEKNKIAVLDPSNQLFEPLKENVEKASENTELVIYKGSEEEAKHAVQEEEYEAFVLLTLNDDQLPEATYFASNVASSMEQQIIQDQLQQLKVGIAVEQAGMDQDIIDTIYGPVHFNAVSLDKAAKTDEELTQARVVVTFMVILMYLVVILYGTMIINDVATEKSSRVMELLVSSASPITHMFAKILGIALLGLTQIGLLVAVGYILIAMKKDELLGGMLDTFGILDIPLSLISYGILFFLLGYALYATIAAMLGSLVSRSEDAQQLMMPLIFLIMIGYFIAIFGISAPDASFITISSYIPFFAPMIMLLRIGVLDISVWETLISIGILVGTIIVTGILGARVYKGGVLMYGKSNSLKDFKKAIELSKKE